MKELLFIIIIYISLNQINGQQMELIAGHVLFRHGDRTPIGTYPTDPMTEKDWPNGFGQLTTAGIEQHHRLGKYLRTRYGSLLNTTYTASEIHVRSTDYDRTLMSAQSNLIGLYSLSNTSNDTVPIQPIPIHTVSMDQDYLLGLNNCSRFDEIENQAYESDEIKKLNIYYEPFFKKLQIWTNLSNMSIANTWGVGDTIFIENIYNKTPVWADENVRKNLSDITDWSFHFSYSCDGCARLRGGPLIQDIWMNMNSSSHGQTFWKVKMYSAHDSTLSAVLSFLGINYLHAPSYASAVFVDLYKQNSAYFVKVEYLNVTDSNKPYPQLLNGCPTMECPLDIFTAKYQPSFPGSADVECTKKTPPTPPGGGSNKTLTVIVTVVAVGVGIIVFVIFGCRYLRRTDRDLPLLSSESSLQIA